MFQGNDECWKYFERTVVFWTYGHNNDEWIDHLKGSFEYALYVERKDLVDKLICYSDIDAYQDAPVIVSVNFSEFTFKRFDLKNSILIPDNSDFEPINLNPDDTVILKGVVIAFIRENLGKL